MGAGISLLPSQQPPCGGSRAFRGVVEAASAQGPSGRGRPSEPQHRPLPLGILGAVLPGPVSTQTSDTDLRKCLRVMASCSALPAGASSHSALKQAEH